MWRCLTTATCGYMCLHAVTCGHKRLHACMGPTRGHARPNGRHARGPAAIDGHKAQRTNLGSTTIWPQPAHLGPRASRKWEQHHFYLQFTTFRCHPSVWWSPKPFFYTCFWRILMLFHGDNFDYSHANFYSAGFFQAIKGVSFPPFLMCSVWKSKKLRDPGSYKQFSFVCAVKTHLPKWVEMNSTVPSPKR